MAGMVDIFCLLQLPNAGDDLQAIKKGIVEIADLVVINKADIDPGATAVVRAQWKNALHWLRPASPNWAPWSLTVSALQKQGVAEVLANRREVPRRPDHHRRICRKAPPPGPRLDVGIDRFGIAPAFPSSPRVRQNLPEALCRPWSSALRRRLPRRTPCSIT